MKIIINATGKAYNLEMRAWTGADWSVDVAEEAIIDGSFSPDWEAEAWRMEGTIEDLVGYLSDWESYDTESDLTYYNDRGIGLDQMRENHPRYYSLEEIAR